MALGSGMDRSEWESKMLGVFAKLMQASGMLYDPAKLGIKIVYRTDPIDHAQWETIAIHKEFDETKKAFLDVGPPPENPADRKRWEASQRQRKAEWEARIRSGTGKKCPQCGSWDTTRITPDMIKDSGKLATALPDRDYLVCNTCSTRTMWESQELEIVHDTEIVFIADILSAPFFHQGKQVRLRHGAIFPMKVNGTHESWRQEEVRTMMYTMFTEEIAPLWVQEAQLAFSDKIREIMAEKR